MILDIVTRVLLVVIVASGLACMAGGIERVSVVCVLAGALITWAIAYAVQVVWDAWHHSKPPD
jgi:ABC-type proline/glycine betaine transport system permease subunit